MHRELASWGADGAPMGSCCSQQKRVACLGIVDEPLPRFDVGREVSGASLLEALDDGLQHTSLCMGIL